MLNRLDDSVQPTVERLTKEGLATPDALLLLGTGVGTLAGSLGQSREVLLGELPDTPTAWRGARLYAGTLGGPGGARVWMLEDDSENLDTADEDPVPPPWQRAWPCWLAAAAGATHAVMTCAGVALASDTEDATPLPLGSFAIPSDHLNLSGATPLRALGPTHLGPLFPDQSRVHDAALGRRFRELAGERGIPCAETVVACAPGPATATPAELRWMASTGAGVAVQDLAAPLIACAHAGLSAVCVIAITDRGDEPLRMTEIVERSEACAPALEDLLLAGSPHLGGAARDERGGEA